MGNAGARLEDGIAKAVTITFALVASFFALGSAIFVHYDSYILVLRQVAFFVAPWVAVVTAFRGAWKLTAALFALTCGIAFWIEKSGTWGIPLLGAVLVAGALIHDARTDPRHLEAQR